MSHPFAPSRRAALAALSASALLGACRATPRIVPPAPVPSVPAQPPRVVPPRALYQPKLVLALGGGAARGFAHVGALEVLDEAGIKPHAIVGTSAGSVVGVIYASGLRAAALRNAAQALDEHTLADWQVPLFNRGLLRGTALERFVNQQVKGRLLQQLNIPTGVVAADLQSGSGVVFRNGNTGQAVRASSAVPGVFEPVRIAGRDYVDGGLVAPVPVRYARQMGGDVVLAVDIGSEPGAAHVGGQLQVLLQTFTIMGRKLAAAELAQADVVVRPALAGMSGADFASRNRSIEAGRSAMRAALPQLQRLLTARER